MPLFIIFVIIPLMEVTAFMAVGDEIGILSTLFLCVLTAMIGAVLLRHQGILTLLSARRTMETGGMPLQQMFDGFCLAVAGVMLMTPGFVTDTMGFALLIPGVRVAVRHWAVRRFDLQAQGFSAQSEQSEDIIEAEFERVQERLGDVDDDVDEP